MSNTIEYNSLKYNITDLEYPDDLSSGSHYGQNKVVFLINVVEDSKIRELDSSVEVLDIPEGEMNQTASQKISFKLTGLTGELEKSAQAEGLTINLKPSAFNKRLKAAISLYIPNDLNFSYNASYGEEDLAVSENVATAFNKLTDGQTGSAITGFFSNKFNSFRKAGFVASATQQTPGNAKVEQIFQGIDFRTFSFNYEFMPRSEKEAMNVMNIINMFKHHMLPEYKDNDQFLFIFPSQFEIKYYKGSSENEYIDKHFTAVLTSCSINYTAAGQFASFDDGMPTNIRMTLTFKELAIPTKETTPYKAKQDSYKNRKKQYDQTSIEDSDRKFTRG